MLLDNKKTAPLVFGLAVFLLLVDRFLKIFALNQDQKYSLIGEILQFNFVKNYFIAFSLPLGGSILIVIIFAIIAFLLVYCFKLAKKKEFIQVALLTNVIFGAISNLVDRLKYGYVIDYIDLKYFTVFNVADAMIVSAILILLVQLNNEKKLNIKKGDIFEEKK